LTYEKIAWLSLTVIIEELNENGDVVSLRDLTPSRVHYPADTSLSLGYAVDQSLRAIEGELVRPAKPQTFPERER
jgi:hypothetical protein